MPPLGLYDGMWDQDLRHQPAGRHLAMRITMAPTLPRKTRTPQQSGRCLSDVRDQDRHQSHPPCVRHVVSRVYGKRIGVDLSKRNAI